MTALLSLLFLFACQHGPLCDSRTITFDASPGATSYTLYWATNNGCRARVWQPTVDVCLATCVAPCRESCVVHVRHPSEGNWACFSLTASNAFGESGH